ncbi:MAG TPA: cupin domain-containing protein [Armatimonadota bacterium]|nr:cupin domain-containing protein [Armatimonadota bacterium]
MKAITLLPAAEAQVQEMAWGRLVWKASAALGNSASMTVGICEIKPGQANPRHHHPNCSEVLHVLRGTIVHSYGDEEVVMSAGDVITVPPNLNHNARNIGDDTAMLAIAFDSADRRTVGE